MQEWSTIDVIVKLWPIVLVISAQTVAVVVFIIRQEGRINQNTANMSNLMSQIIGPMQLTNQEQWSALNKYSDNIHAVELQLTALKKDVEATRDSACRVRTDFDRHQEKQDVTIDRLWHGIESHGGGRER